MILAMEWKPMSKIKTVIKNNNSKKELFFLEFHYGGYKTKCKKKKNTADKLGKMILFCCHNNI